MKKNAFKSKKLPKMSEDYQPPEEERQPAQDDDDTMILAETLKDAYQQQRRLQTQDMTYKVKPQKRHQADYIWTKIALFVKMNKLDPLLYIRAVFVFNQVPGGPFPNQLLSQNNVREYHQYLRTIQLEVPEGQTVMGALTCRRWEDAVQRMVSLNMTNLDFALSRMDTLPAWLRLGICDNPQVWRRYGLDAFYELQNHPWLADVLIRHIELPADLIKRIQEYPTKMHERSVFIRPLDVYSSGRSDDV